MKSQRLLISFLFLLLISACVKSKKIEPTPSASPVNLTDPSGATSAQVGDFKITAADAEAIQAVHKVHDEMMSLSKEKAIVALAGDLMIAQIAKNNGIPVDHETLVKEAKRFESLDTSRKFNDRILAIFAPSGKFGTEMYLRDVVLPQYAVRMIYHEYFLKNQKTQKEAHERAISFIQKVLANPNDFDKIAKELGLKTGIFRATELLVRPETADFEVPSILGGKQLVGTFDFLATPEERTEAYRVRADHDLVEKGRDVRIQQLIPEPIEVKEGWWVYRELEKIRKPRLTMRLEGVYFPKADYSTWLEQEMAKVKVEYYKGSSHG